MHDETYKKVFAFPRMVEDLLRGFVDDPEPDELDFSTLEKLSAEYVSADLLKRHGDNVWRVRLRGRRRSLYVLVLLEFQSQDDSWMALRILTYTGLLYEELIRNGKVAEDGLLPPVLPVVLYNGERPWKAAQEMGALIAPVGGRLAACQPAQRYLVVDERRVAEDDLPSGNAMRAVVRLEQSRSAGDLARVVEALQAALRDPREEELRRVFVEWVQRTAERAAPPGAPPPRLATLEELKMGIVERAAEWPKQWLREGIEQGLEQGVKQGIEQGIEQGVKQGVEQGIEQQRALLSRLAALRFGPETGGRVAQVLERIADPERLAVAGEGIVQSATGDEMVARVTRLAAAGETS